MRFAVITFTVWAALALWTTLHHEAWGDEADVWLTARDGGLTEIFAHTAQRGTPALWYLVVWPFAAAGAPYVAQQLLNLAFAGGAVLLVLRGAPLPRLLRVLFAFSYFPLFEYAAVARPYALLMLLMLAVAAGWGSRDERPLRLAVAIALLANTTLHGLIVAAVAGLLLSVEWFSGARASRPLVRRRPAAAESETLSGQRARTPALRIAALAVMLAGGMASLVQLWPRPGAAMPPYLVGAGTIGDALAGAFFPGLRVTSFLLPAILVTVLIAAGVSRHFVPAAFFALSTVLLLFVFVFVWMDSFRHGGILLVVAVAAIWIADAYGPLRWERQTMAALAVSLTISLVPAYNSVVVETRMAYSGSRDAARFLSMDPRQLVLDHASNAVLAYLPPRRVWDAARGGYGSFSTWNTMVRQPGVERALEAAERRFAAEKWLLLTGEELPERAAARYRLLYRTASPVWSLHGEKYWVYEPLGGR